MSDGGDFPACQVSAKQLRGLVERIERLEEEKKEVAEQIKEVYAEAKGNGFDTKTLRRIVKERGQSPEERSEQAAMMDLYRTALGMQPRLEHWAEAQGATASRALRKAGEKFGVEIAPADPADPADPAPEPPAPAPASGGAKRRGRGKAVAPAPEKAPEIAGQDLSPKAAAFVKRQGGVAE